MSKEAVGGHAPAGKFKFLGVMKWHLRPLLTTFCVMVMACIKVLTVAQA